VSSKTKNPDKVKIVLQYMADEKDTTGWLHIATQEIGWKPALPYSEAPKMSNTAIDFQKYVDGGNIVPWLYDMYPKGFNQDIEGSLGSYFIGQIKKDKFIQDIDKGWHDTAALQYGKQ
jgi:hypothetical protein